MSLRSKTLLVVAAVRTRFAELRHRAAPHLLNTQACRRDSSYRASR